VLFGYAAICQSHTTYVRFRTIADIAGFWPGAVCPLMTQSGHWPFQNASLSRYDYPSLTFGTAMQRRDFITFFCGAVLPFIVAAPITGPAAAQSEPIKIGYGMALTGGLAPNGKSALLAQKIWEKDVNTKGGLLGRPVKLIYYDDQTNPAAIPGIYTKLLDADKVDLILGGYGTTMVAAAVRSYVRLVLLLK
jgi:ABC-type branched-subunit amino acid transport system substrate-binding protein